MQQKFLYREELVTDATLPSVGQGEGLTSNDRLPDTERHLLLLSIEYIGKVVDLSNCREKQHV